ncbi:hypothetical protein OG735_39305 [Streptomyces sp. NBC_01210]|nr:hypothetical protein OG735_39305 [Streptomyces sp. NBC_01210]
MLGLDGAAVQLAVGLVRICARAQGRWPWEQLLKDLVTDRTDR